MWDDDLYGISILQYRGNSKIKHGISWKTFLAFILEDDRLRVIVKVTPRQQHLTLNVLQPEALRVSIINVVSCGSHKSHETSIGLASINLLIKAFRVAINCTLDVLKLILSRTESNQQMTDHLLRAVG